MHMTERAFFPPGEIAGGFGSARPCKQRFSPGHGGGRSNRFPTLWTSVKLEGRWDYRRFLLAAALRQ